MKKTIVIGGASLVLILTIGLYLLYNNLDRIIKVAVEKYGSEILQVSVKLNKVKIDPANGIGVLQGLSIKNPNGFETDYAFQLDQVKLHLDIESILDPTIVIKEISIDEPAITYEWSQKGSNFDRIQANVNNYTGGEKATPTKQAPTQASKSSSDKKLVINDFYLRKSNVALSANVGPVKGKKIEKTLRTIHLKDIGKSKKGATPKEVTKAIIDRLMSELKPLAADIGLGQFRDLANQKMKEAQNQAKNMAKEQVQKAIPKGNPLAGKIKSPF